MPKGISYKKMSSQYYSEFLVDIYILSSQNDSEKLSSQYYSEFLVDIYILSSQNDSEKLSS
ncbi:MAG: hypothetical protein M0R46_16110, partial [Candidatus Muirbacterium halophilum]|nr:hypothetical protein [Candidatus Muirbacterium halophilum]